MSVAFQLRAGCEIPAIKYKLSTLVGFRHPVITMHAWSRPGSSRCTCLDHEHTRGGLHIRRPSSIKPMLLFLLYLHLFKIIYVEVNKNVYL